MSKSLEKYSIYLKKFGHTSAVHPLLNKLKKHVKQTGGGLENLGINKNNPLFPILKQIYKESEEILDNITKLKTQLDIVTKEKNILSIESKKCISDLKIIVAKVDKLNELLKEKGFTIIRNSTDLDSLTNELESTKKDKGDSL